MDKVTILIDNRPKVRKNPSHTNYYIFINKKPIKNILEWTLDININEPLKYTMTTINKSGAVHKKSYHDVSYRQCDNWPDILKAIAR